MFGFRPMETIVETNSNPESPVMADHARTHVQTSPTQAQAYPNLHAHAHSHSLDALVRSLNRPARQESEGGVRPSPPALVLDPTLWRSNSDATYKVTSRKPSQRVLEWMKRSNTVRTAKIAEAVSPTGTRHTIKIAHLGGGRVGDDEIQPAISVGAAQPAQPTLRRQKSRADSTDTRVTQWIDLYPEAFESFSPPPTRERSQPKDRPKSPHQQQQQQPKPESTNDVPKAETPLRPAPLRFTPLARKETPVSTSTSMTSSSSKPASKPASPSSSGNKTPEKPLVRKNSKWKPLPQLPPPPTDNTPPSPAPAALVTPPPTPDSSEAKEVLMVEPEPPAPPPLSAVELTVPSPPTTRDTNEGLVPTSEEATASEANPLLTTPRHTRQERIWLHNNYRGEAPFLAAWGMDIRNPEDRREGLIMLRELMLAEVEEAERKEREEEEGKKKMTKGGVGSSISTVSTSSYYGDSDGADVGRLVIGVVGSPISGGDGLGRFELS